MKKTFFMLGLLLTITACATEPVPTDVQQRVDAMPEEQVPHNFYLERDSCGGEIGEARTACREKVRREYLAGQIAREERNAQ